MRVRPPRGTRRCTCAGQQQRACCSYSLDVANLSSCPSNTDCNYVPGHVSHRCALTRQVTTDFMYFILIIVVKARSKASLNRMLRSAPWDGSLVPRVLGLHVASTLLTISRISEAYHLQPIASWVWIHHVRIRTCSMPGLRGLHAVCQVRSQWSTDVTCCGRPLKRRV